MVKLYALSVYYKKDLAGILLKSTYDLQSFSFFQRGTVEEFMTFVALTILERTPPASRQSIKQDPYMCHVYLRHDNLGAVIISDHEYPQRVAHTVLNKVLDDFTATVSSDKWENGNPQTINFTSLPSILAKYQDPKEADALTKMQHDLDETKIILKDTIGAVLNRGEKLEDMVVKSENLSAQSKAFYKTAKKTNACCSFS